MEIETIQKLIASLGKQAWITIDYENKNKALCGLLGGKMLTRKIIAVFYANRRPALIAHSIDCGLLKDGIVDRRFDIIEYKTWQQMLDGERKALENLSSVLMDYSENGLLMRVASADAGSVEFVKSLGIKVESSGDLLQSMTAVLTDRQYEEELKACELTLAIKDEAFAFIKRQIEEKGQTSELEVQRFIAKRFVEEGMTYDDAPLVANGKNAANPHYSPDENHNAVLKEGDLVLIDMWAKLNDQDGVYADITWMGYIGKEVPEVYASRFEIVKAARKGVIKFLKREIPNRDVYAYEADDVARKTISDAGYGEYFLHRVGHNIAVDVSPHGPGANLDNYETHDDRKLLEGTSFSDEPGIYAPDFGMRSETNIHIRNRQAIVVAGGQEEIIPIMK